MKWELVVLLIFLVACAKPAVEPAAQTAPVAKVADTGMLDIAKAVQLGKPIKCVSEQAGQTTTIYMKGSKMRMDTVPADAHGIYTEELMYTWQAKQGSVMKLADIHVINVWHFFRDFLQKRFQRRPVTVFQKENYFLFKFRRKLLKDEFSYYLKGLGEILLNDLGYHEFLSV